MSELVWVSGFPNAGSILRSLDGTTLQQITLPLGSDHVTQEFSAIDPVAHIWAFHDYSDGSLALQKSIDGGDSWATVVNRVSLPGGAKAYPYGLLILPSGRLVITAATSTGLAAIAYSDNNGTSWTVVQVSSNANIYATCCLWVDQTGTLWACGAQYYDGNIYKSTDNGTTWTQVLVGVPAAGTTYGFATLGLANNVLFLTISSPNPGGSDPHFAHLASSFDGGATWGWRLYTDDSGWQTAGRTPVAYDSIHSKFITVSNQYLFASGDGAAWSSGTFINGGPGTFVGGCFFNGTVLVAMAAGPGNDVYWESNNGGTTWTKTTLPNFSQGAWADGDSQWIDPPLILMITSGSNQIQNDPQPNVVGGAPFTVTVSVLKQDGTVDTSYSGATVTVYANDAVGHYPNALGSAVFLNGVATVPCTPLTVVFDNIGYRSLQARDTNGLASPGFDIWVYFNVWMDIEFCRNCPNDPLGGYCVNPVFCNGTLPPNSQFIALPNRDQTLCNRGINIATSLAGSVVATVVEDIGPSLNNNYWNTGNYKVNPGNPLGCVSDGLAQLLGITFGCTPAGHAFGGSAVYWRFQ